MIDYFEQKTNDTQDQDGKEYKNKHLLEIYTHKVSIRIRYGYKICG